MMMNLQDIHQERKLVLVAIKVGLVSLEIKWGLVFVRVRLGVDNNSNHN